MIYILLNFVVFIPGSLSSSLEESRSDSSADVTSLSKLAAAISKLRGESDDVSIDLDYWNGVSDEPHHDRQESKYQERLAAVTPHPRYVYISNPQVLKDYQKNLQYLKLARSWEASSSDKDDLSDVSFKDILEFLLQLQVRLDESEERTADESPSISISKLKRIRNKLRRVNDHSDPERAPGSSFISDAKDLNLKVHRKPGSREKRVRNKKNERETVEIDDEDKGKLRARKKRDSLEITRESRSKEHIEHSVERGQSLYNLITRIGDRRVKEPPRNSLKVRGNLESMQRPMKFLQNNDRYRSKNVAKRLPSFIGTQIPMRGSKSVYEK